MGLNHMKGRVQDAILGRFLSPDPHIPSRSNAQSYNRYSYVNNNPVSNIDPTGFRTVPCKDYCSIPSGIGYWRPGLVASVFGGEANYVSDFSNSENTGVGGMFGIIGNNTTGDGPSAPPTTDDSDLAPIVVTATKIPTDADGTPVVASADSSTSPQNQTASDPQPTEVIITAQRMSENQNTDDIYEEVTILSSRETTGAQRSFSPMRTMRPAGLAGRGKVLEYVWCWFGRGSRLCTSLGAMGESMRAKFLLKLLMFCCIGAVVFAAGYFEAWHRSLSRQYSATELIVDLDVHYLRHLRETGQLDNGIEQEMSGMILAQLGFLLELRNLQEKSIFWAFTNPRTFLEISQQVTEPRSLEESITKAQIAGVNISALEEFPGFPKQLH